MLMLAHRWFGMPATAAAAEDEDEAAPAAR
jgi:hypothetical protein